MQPPNTAFLWIRIQTGQKLEKAKEKKKLHWRGVEPRACAWKAPELGMLDDDWVGRVEVELTDVTATPPMRIVEVSAFLNLMAFQVADDSGTRSRHQSYILRW